MPRQRPAALVGRARTVGIEQEKLADILKDERPRGRLLQTGGGPMADFENVVRAWASPLTSSGVCRGRRRRNSYIDTLERAGLSQQEMTFI